MIRRIYTAFLKTGKEQYAISKLTETGTLTKNLKNASLFRYGKQIFLYFESIGEEISPEDIFDASSDFLEECPGMDGPRYWVMMYDIFHYQAPQADKQWRPDELRGKPVGRVVYLKPEMIASYIFYHYQYQEEKPGDGDKYGIIGIHGNMLFFYLEEPTYHDRPAYKGTLSTNNTPDNWSALMKEHFLCWPDQKGTDDNWRNTEVLIS